MAFDFTKLIAEETKKQQEESQRSSSSGGIGFKTLYPFGNGRLELKFIGNEPSGLLYREMIFHEYYANSKKQKTPCLRNMYGMDCPICNAVNNVQDQLGDDKVFGKYGFKRQGLMFAKLLGFAPDNYFGDSKNPPKVGDIVCFMFPKSVINELRNLIVEFSDEVEDLFTNNTTRTVTLKIGTKSNGFPEYTFYVKGTSTTLCVDDNGQADNEAFNKFMIEMPNLKDVKFPAAPNEDIMNTHKTIVEEINKTYFGERVNVPMSDPTPMNSNINTTVVDKVDTTEPPTATMPTNTVSESTSTAESNDSSGNRPECFGNNEYAGKCLDCPWESQCI